LHEVEPSYSLFVRVAQASGCAYAFDWRPDACAKEGDKEALLNSSFLFPGTGPEEAKEEARGYLPRLSLGALLGGGDSKV